MSMLCPLSKPRWYVRWPVKWIVFLVTAVLVVFPNVSLLIRQIEHFKDPNSLIEPDEPRIVAMADELTPKVADAESGKAALKKVERFVHKKIPYSWDWVTWGNADYMPTVAEILDKGTEDCDGRAVIAASILKRLGYKAELVTDFRHVWVKTDKGETMGPGKVKVVVATKEGLKVREGALMELLKSSGYGISVFPFYRELIIVAVAWWLMLGRRARFGSSMIALAMMINGLLFLRVGGTNYRAPEQLIQWVGLGNFLLAFFVLWVWAPLTAKPVAPAEPVFD